MKPLPPAQWTDEDFAILTAQWEGRDWRRPRLYPLGHSVYYDRRDAELMLTLRKGACPLCLGEVEHTVECVEWRWDIYRVNAMRRRLQRI